MSRRGWGTLFKNCFISPKFWSSFSKQIHRAHILMSGFEMETKNFVRSEGPAWAWACFFIMPRSQLAIVLNEQFKYIMIIHFWFRIERPYIREYTVHTIQMSRSTVLHLLKGSLLGRRYRRPGCQTSDFCKLCLHLCASSWHQLVSILWQ